MFPYTGIVEAASARNCFSKAEVAELLALAEQNNLEVIPLVQTFGHLEHLVRVIYVKSEHKSPTSIP